MAEQRAANPFRVKLFGLFVLGVFVAGGRPAVQAKTAKEKALASQVRDRQAEQSGLLWQEPADMATRDLLYGIGEKRHAPHGSTYTFVKEDSSDSSPKFVVKDSDGVRWKVKLGPEARGEIAATRLVWAAGYFTDEDYYLPELRIKDLPELRRGKQLVWPGGMVRTVRMERDIEGQEKAGSWKWKQKHWPDRRAFNGLKVMMALINNWDLKDNNTAVYKRRNSEGQVEYIYAVSDLGASFGQTHLDRAQTKANLALFEASKFIDKIGPEHVRLATPGAPTPYLLVNPKDYFYRRGLMAITRSIPREDAHWIGELLSHLSKQQIRDAFRAGGFTTDETEAFALVVEQRIQQLRQL